MIDLKNRQIYDDGTVICKESAVFEMLYAGQSLDTVIAEPCRDIELYNQADHYLDSNYGEIATAQGEQFTGVDWFEHWLTPEPYNTIDLRDYLVSKCQSTVELQRLESELQLYTEHKMLPVLRHLIYLVDHWREHNIVWGVGRGSSVSSFVLYLIGINRINPLDYDLAIEDFIK